MPWACCRLTDDATGTETNYFGVTTGEYELALGILSFDLVWAALLLLVVAICWVLTGVGLPGNWLMIVAATAYILVAPVQHDSRASIGWWIVPALILLAALGELLEFLAGALGTAKVGASRRGVALALVGSLTGAALGLFVGLPIPLIGPLLGSLLLAALGALIGAMFGERWKGRALGESWQVGKAAFWGRMLGTAGKIAVGGLLCVLTAVALLV